MLDDQDNVFDIIYSLPVIGHSAAIATRTPTAGYGQQSKYMPDYGGIMETPFSNLKNNALASGLPFQPTSIYRNISKLETPHGIPLTKQISNDCLIVSSHFDSASPDKYSVIRAIGTHLYFDFIQDNILDSGAQESSTKNYAHVPYSDDITGIKMSGNQKELLTVKFLQGVKTIKINPTYEVTLDDNSSSSAPSGFAVNFLTSIAERQQLQVKDVCLNPFNKLIQAIASDNADAAQVRIFDISADSRRPIQTVNIDSRGNGATGVVNNDRVLRNRIVRVFEPAKPALRGIQEIDNIPFHLVNMMLTTDQKVELIDPRVERATQTYVDRTKIPSFYPIEFLRRTRYSRKNSHQFYSLTNVHLRVFDTRFPGVQLNQQNHMLDSETYDSMNLKVINNNQNDLETLCVSSQGRLCFSTFDQTQESKLINPRANHLPYHEPSLEEMILEGNSELFGLDIRDNVKNWKSSTKELFHIYQLTVDGDISVRKFLPNDEDRCQDIVHETQASKIIRRDKLSSALVISSNVREGHQCDDRDVLGTEKAPEDVEYINLLETDIFADIENTFQSKRASERYGKIQAKLDKS